MWPETDRLNLSPEQLEERASLLTDLIELGEGKTIQELHPDMSTKELAERMLMLVQLKNTL